MQSYIDKLKQFSRGYSSNEINEISDTCPKRVLISRKLHAQGGQVTQVHFIVDK